MINIGGNVLASACWANRGNRNYFYYGFTTSHESNHNILCGTKWRYARCSINGNAMIK
jgi:hypothetical protein